MKPRACSVFCIFLLFCIAPSLFAERTMLVDRGDITHIQSVAYQIGLFIFKRDLIGDDRQADRLEVRLWDDNLGYSTPIVVVLDTDCDGFWDEVYGTDLSVAHGGPLWTEPEIVLTSRTSSLVGLAVKDRNWERLISLVLSSETVRSPGASRAESM